MRRDGFRRGPDPHGTGGPEGPLRQWSPRGSPLLRFKREWVAGEEPVLGLLFCRALEGDLVSLGLSSKEGLGGDEGDNDYTCHSDLYGGSLHEAPPPPSCRATTLLQEQQSL